MRWKMSENNQKQSKTRQKYSPQFKDQAIERAEKDGVPQVAKDLGIKESLLYYWRSQKKHGGSSLENQKLQQAELSRLKRENQRLQEENAFLKKVATYFTKESK
jgi:transposase